MSSINNFIPNITKNSQFREMRNERLNSIMVSQYHCSAVWVSVLQKVICRFFRAVVLTFFCYPQYNDLPTIHMPHLSATLARALSLFPSHLSGCSPLAGNQWNKWNHVSESTETVQLILFLSVPWTQKNAMECIGLYLELHHLFLCSDITELIPQFINSMERQWRFHMLWSCAGWNSQFGEKCASYFRCIENPHVVEWQGMR